MTTCQTPNVSVIKDLNVVSTPPGARTWLAPRSQTPIYKVENTSYTVPEPVSHNYKMEYRRNN